jgi:hypothetical protein
MLHRLPRGVAGEPVGNPRKKGPAETDRSGGPRVRPSAPPAPMTLLRPSDMLLPAR